MSNPSLPSEFIGNPRTPAEKYYNAVLAEFEPLIETLGDNADRSGAWQVYLEQLGAAEVAVYDPEP